MKPGHRCVDCELVNRRLQALEQPGALDVDEDEDEDEDVEPPHVDEDLEALDQELHRPPPAKVRKTTFNTFKPGTRQLPPKASQVDSPRNWWETAKPGEMTKAAEEEKTRMSSSKQAKRVTGSIND